jgi:hypothetical protein
MRGLPERERPKLFCKMLVLFSEMAMASVSIPSILTLVFHNFCCPQENIFADYFQHIFQLVAIRIVISN